MSASVLIFTKAPRMGLSKTRLARGLGKAEAQRLARMSFARTLRAAIDPRWRTTLYAAPDRDLDQSFGGLWPEGLERVSQGRGDLGARLTKGFREARRGPVIFIGADAPDVSKALIWSAIRALKCHDAVAGPATDGGFWLLGLKRGLRARPPFYGVRWSSEHALADVEANLGSNAWIHHIRTLIDLDEADDWRAWATSRRR
ncbi:MAG: TIGR04282 family arsenosugar biosynthesis glycosyltransferase [Pseudomonadota bacterium]